MPFENYLSKKYRFTKYLKSGVFFFFFFELNVTLKKLFTIFTNKKITITGSGPQKARFLKMNYMQNRVNQERLFSIKVITWTVKIFPVQGHFLL